MTFDEMKGYTSSFSELMGNVIDELGGLDARTCEIEDAIKYLDCCDFVSSNELENRVSDAVDDVLDATDYVTHADVDDIVKGSMCDTMNDLENRVESLESNDFDDLEHRIESLEDEDFAYRIESLEDKDIDDIDYRLSQAESSIQDFEYGEYVSYEDVADMIRERTKELEQKIEEMNDKEWSITVLKAKIYDLYIQNGIIK